MWLYRDLLDGDNSNKLLEIDLSMRNESYSKDLKGLIEFDINSIHDGSKYLNIVRYNRTRNMGNRNKHNIRSHLIKLKDENV